MPKIILLMTDALDYEVAVLLFNNKENMLDAASVIHQMGEAGVIVADMVKVREMIILRHVKRDIWLKIIRMLSARGITYEQWTPESVRPPSAAMRNAFTHNANLALPKGKSVGGMGRASGESYGSARYNHWKDWHNSAIRRGYQIEPDGSGKLVAHLDGDERGVWNGNYGGAGFGWFYEGVNRGLSRIKTNLGKDLRAMNFDDMLVKMKDQSASFKKVILNVNEDGSAEGGFVFYARTTKDRRHKHQHYRPFTMTADQRNHDLSMFTHHCKMFGIHLDSHLMTYWEPGRYHISPEGIKRTK